MTDKAPKTKISVDARSFVLVLLAAIAVGSAVNYISANSLGVDYATASLSEEGKRVQDALTEVADSFESDTVEGKVCRAGVQIIAYDLSKDTLRNGHRYTSLYSNMAQTNALFSTILIMIFVGLFFSVFQMATAYSVKMKDSPDIEIEAANIKVRTGYVSIAMTVIAVISLSFYLTYAYEVKEISGSMDQINVPFDDLLDACSEHAKSPDVKN